jgi:hypothetical protein
MLTTPRTVSIATIVDYLHVQLTSEGPLPSVLPPVHVAVLPSGQVTEHDWVLSALFAEHVFRPAALAKFALKLAMATVDAISRNARIRLPPL